jgi:hypothetical protein
MAVESNSLLNPSLFFMEERDRDSTQRNYFCFESMLPAGVKYEMVKGIADSLDGGFPGMSASQQLSALEIQELIDNLPSQRFTIIDLREEAHFFIDGFPVSLTNKDNNPNQGKHLSQIEKDEEDIIQAFQKSAITLHKRSKKKEISAGTKVKVIDFLPQAPILPKTIETEGMLVKSLKGTYIRIPITDHGFPSEDQIDKLISLYEIQKKKLSSVHFHCAAGCGRSSTALAIFAILHWAKTLSLTEIFSRLESRGNVQLLKPVKAGKPIKQRSDFFFWTHFYDFARNRAADTQWSSWVNPI